MKKLLLILPLFFFSCSEEDPKPTIIEGRFLWEDGTMATGIRMEFLGQDDDGGFILFHQSQGVNKITLELEDDNEFYIDLPANSDVDKYVINIAHFVENIGYVTYGQCVVQSPVRATTNRRRNRYPIRWYRRDSRHPAEQVSGWALTMCRQTPRHLSNRGSTQRAGVALRQVPRPV